MGARPRAPRRTESLKAPPRRGFSFRLGGTYNLAILRSLLIIPLLAAALFFPASASAIIGGTPAEDAPWLLRLSVGGSVCSGTLISPGRVLSAAHCFRRSGRVVASARVEYGSGVFSELRTQVVPRSSIRLMPSFRSARSGWRDDLAVLRLSEPLISTPLPPSQGLQSRTQRSALMFGWGATEDFRFSSRALSTEAPLLSLPACRSLLSRLDLDASAASLWLCAGDNAKGVLSSAHTACLGDSGGPLLLGGRLVGVLSWFFDDGHSQGARACLSSPMFYTRLGKSQLAWVKKQ